MEDTNTKKAGRVAKRAELGKSPDETQSDDIQTGWNPLNFQELSQLDSAELERIQSAVNLEVLYRTPEERGAKMLRSALRKQRRALRQRLDEAERPLEAFVGGIVDYFDERGADVVWDDPTRVLTDMPTVLQVSIRVKDPEMGRVVIRARVHCDGEGSVSILASVRRGVFGRSEYFDGGAVDSPMTAAETALDGFAHWAARQEA